MNPVFGPAPFPDPYQPLDLAQQQRFLDLTLAPGLLIDGQPVPALDDHSRGLYGKYLVSRADGSDPEGAEYFVLRMDKGLAPELAAMRAYVAACEAEYPQLAADLRARYLADKPADQVRPATATNDAHPLPGDRYLHVKTGNIYRVLHIAVCTETSAEFVVYEREDPAERDEQPWLRPLYMWVETVRETGRPRFELLPPRRPRMEADRRFQVR